MSFVLKALKKLENEKADKIGGPSNIARDILQGNTLSRKRSRSIFPLVAVLVLIGVGTFFLAGGTLSPSEPENALSSPPAAESAAAPQESVAAATPETPALEPAAADPAAADPAAADPAAADPAAAMAAPESPAESTPAAVSPVPPVQEAAPSPSPAPAAAENRGAVLETLGKKAQETVEKNRQTAESLKKTAESLQQTAAALKGKVVIPKSSLPVVIQETKPSPSQASAQPARTVTISRAQASSAARDSRTAPWALAGVGSDTVPELKVSEVHYREDVRDRLAVVNDLPVMEGMVIEGAKVDRIFKDRVRFVINGKYHEIKLP
ncbi:hypothetical protein DESUT3_21590 [Desulfuromonas versatilis]|uniref:General secretion pathway protein B n=1 Tax=Desulfuromonas versatilis TaxID=2802975 RepID=A0ABM8HWY5_9BACT|nr:hypothetical protein [Desulfuromonas versatilis]BCR05090.1 hypothetical protein DESUT3_21590 [Desulfuromonas versatilis]